MKLLVDDVGFIKQRWKEGMAKVMKTCWQSHMMLFIVSTFNIIVIWLDTKGILLKIIAGQKTVPMSDYFSLFIVSSDFIQIG